jgi:hypothetical protein
LIQVALVATRANDFGDHDAPRAEQVVDVPAKDFLGTQMARDARLEATPGRPRVDVAAGGKVKPAQSAYGAANGLPDVDLELVADVSAHLGPLFSTVAVEGRGLRRHA